MPHSSWACSSCFAVADLESKWNGRAAIELQAQYILKRERLEDALEACVASDSCRNSREATLGFWRQSTYRTHRCRSFAPEDAQSIKEELVRRMAYDLVGKRAGEEVEGAIAETIGDIDVSEEMSVFDPVKRQPKIQPLW